MSRDIWRMGFHLMPPTGWGNDPNGLCQFRGTYHVFHQYSPDWPQKGERAWGHFSSPDLIHWQHHGVVIHQDTPDDANGAYSGSALVVPGAASDGGDLLRLYYTGNVKHPGDYDYINAGREANEILVTSEDGYQLSPKKVLLRSADYPGYCSCHVRDPKVWRQDGSYHMLLGARDRDSQALVLVYDSDDGDSWSLRRAIRPQKPFGFMWECPDRIELDGHEYLACCPQGMPAKNPDGSGTSWSGTFALDGKLIDAESVDTSTYVELDRGFDFYAPQTFVDDSGRTLLIGWVGMPDEDFCGQPDGMSWIHSYTVPRVLTRAEDGRILQNPIPELDQLHGAHAYVPAQGSIAFDQPRLDLRLDDIQGAGSLSLDGALHVAWGDGKLTLSFSDPAVGIRRHSRSCDCDLHDLRVLVDNSLVELYANGGREAFSTRWFPQAERLDVSLDSHCQANAWTMQDCMTKTYEA
ncbi:MAG: glycoside hydrolase family 32 protein [Atopobiaceae bacterium]